MIRFVAIAALFLTLAVLVLPARSEPAPVTIHNCPSAVQFGDELDVDFWC